MKFIGPIFVLIIVLHSDYIFQTNILLAATVESPDGASWGIFGKDGGHIHPFCSLSGMYTDNLYTARKDRIEDFATIISPGIWLSIPGRKKPADSINTTPGSAGGIMVAPFAGSDSRRLSLFLGGSRNIERYVDYTDENTESGALEAQFRYQMKNGMSFTVNGQRNRTYEERGMGASTALEKYTSTYAQIKTMFNPNGKLALTAGYTSFNVDYDSVRYRFRDRVDNTFSFDIAYPILPKTDGFVECSVYDIDYLEKAQPNSTEKHYDIGLRWNISSKSRGVLKAGYGEKKTGDSVSAEDLNVEARMNYIVSSDTTVYSTLYKKYQESIYTGTDYIDSLGMTLGGNYEFTPRINLDLFLEVAAGDHYAGRAKIFDENEFSISPSLAYQWKKWVIFKVEYTYERRSVYDVMDSQDAVSSTVYFSVLMGG